MDPKTREKQVLPCSGSHWILYLGSVDLTTSESGRQIAQSVDARLHEGFQDETLANDVALIFLRTPVTLTHDVRPVDLATVDYGDFDHQPVRTSGWGATSDYSNLISDVLQFTNLTVITNAECYKHYGDVVQSWTICASGQGVTNPCNGDSGGPLVVRYRYSTLQVGVTSFVGTSGCSGEPSGYVRVSYYQNWIRLLTGI